MRWFELALECVAAVMLAAFLFGVTYTLVTKYKAQEEVVSSLAPPKVCGKVGPLTIYC